ncbi:hypothetical protein C7N83_00665 [Neisseria iguanae]|uniref:IstB-like ATP-binding domain-containing protein n=1 Tax=Neisseria iguanae TaxID=90242 RepID=A0A2P7U3C4_9NEIS|nr:hypothetical protein C7N83_00665 [Neisseria iguanae]
MLYSRLIKQGLISIPAVHNSKGHVGKTLKDLGRSQTVKNLVVAAATAGVADKIGASSALQWSKNATVNQLTVNLASAGSSAVISTAVNGGSLKDTLEAEILAALVNTAHGAAASKIKQINGETWYRQVAHKIAHAVAGCAAGATNKTWLARALGVQACRNGFKTSFYNATQLLTDLELAVLANEVHLLKQKLVKPQLLIIDDFGIGAIQPSIEARLLDIIDKQSANGGLMITAQIPPEKWFDLFHDAAVADAILDRIIHRSHRINLTGDSMRKRKGGVRLDSL